MRRTAVVAVVVDMEGAAEDTWVAAVIWVLVAAAAILPAVILAATAGAVVMAMVDMATGATADPFKSPQGSAVPMATEGDSLISVPPDPCGRAATV
jgi:hypothetical protein